MLDIRISKVPVIRQGSLNQVLLGSAIGASLHETLGCLELELELKKGSARASRAVMPGLYGIT